MNGNLSITKSFPATVTAEAHIQLFSKVLSVMNMRHESKLCRV